MTQNLTEYKSIHHLGEKLTDRLGELSLTQWLRPNVLSIGSDKKYCNVRKKIKANVDLNLKPGTIISSTLRGLPDNKTINSDKNIC